MLKLGVRCWMADVDWLSILPLFSWNIDDHRNNSFLSAFNSSYLVMTRKWSKSICFIFGNEDDSGHFKRKFTVPYSKQSQVK